MPAIHLTYDEDDDILDVFAEIGCVPDGGEALYREFLFDNLFMKGTKGAVFAASPQTGCVVLQREIDIGAMDDSSFLAEALADFAEVTLNARRRFSTRTSARTTSHRLGNGRSLTLDGFPCTESCGVCPRQSEKGIEK